MDATTRKLIASLEKQAKQHEASAAKRGALIPYLRGGERKRLQGAGVQSERTRAEILRARIAFLKKQEAEKT